MQNKILTYVYLEKNTKKILFVKKSMIPIRLNNSLLLTKIYSSEKKIETVENINELLQKKIFSLLALKTNLELQKKSISDFYKISNIFKYFKSMHLPLYLFISFYLFFIIEKKALLNKTETVFEDFEKIILSLNSVVEINAYVLKFKETVVQGGFALVNKVKEI